MRRARALWEFPETLFPESFRMPINFKIISKLTQGFFFFFKLETPQSPSHPQPPSPKLDQLPSFIPFLDAAIPFPLSTFAGAEGGRSCQTPSSS